MNICRPLILAIVLIGSAPAEAQTLGYTFVSAKFLRFSSNAYAHLEEIDGFGFSTDLSLAVTPAFALTAKVLRLNNADVIADGARSSVDLGSYAFGFVIHAPLSKVSDFILKVDFLAGDFHVDGAFSGNQSADGSQVSMGVRSMKSNNLELSAFVIKHTIFIHKVTIETKTNIGIGMGAAYYPRETTSINLELSFDRDTSVLALGVTKYF